MNKLKKFIAQILKNKNLKWVLVFFVVGGLFVGKTYAQVDNEMTTIDNISFFMHLIFSIASWGWVILANLAGKLMTNDLVYGSFLHLDASLWTLWNIMKNFANFALGFLVLFSIVKNVFSIGDGGEGKWKPKKIIINTLMAGVLIQMSWFMMGAVIDLSTIMTSAIGSFPSQFMMSSDEFKQDINENLGNLRKGKVTFAPKNSQEIVKWEPNSETIAEMDLEGDDYKKLLDTIMPSYDSVSGPLLFLGLSVFDLNDFGSRYTGNGGSQTATERGDLFMQLGISSLVLLFFSLMLFFIFIFNLFRLIMLWLIIPLMPIIILLKVFDILPSGDSFSFLKIKTILNLIFKPVIMVGALSIVLIVLVLIKSVIKDNNSGSIPLGNGTAVLETMANGDQYVSTIKSDGILEYTMEGKDTIADLIVYFFGLFLMFFVVKISIQTKTGVGFIDNSLDKMFKVATSAVSNLPIIPIGSGVSVSAIREGDFDNVADNISRSIGIDAISRISNLPDFMQPTEAVKEKERREFAISLFKSDERNEDWDMFYKDNEVKDKITEWNKSNPNNNIIDSTLKAYHKDYSDDRKLNNS